MKLVAKSSDHLPVLILLLALSADFAVHESAGCWPFASLTATQRYVRSWGLSGSGRCGKSVTPRAGAASNTLFDPRYDQAQQRPSAKAIAPWSRHAPMA